MCEAITRGARHDRGNHMGCEACARQLQGVQGMCEAATGVCEAATMGARHVQGIYNGCEACTRQI